MVNQAPALQKLLMEKEAAASPVYPHVSPTAIRYRLTKARAQSREMETQFLLFLPIFLLLFTLRMSGHRDGSVLWQASCEWGQAMV